MPFPGPAAAVIITSDVYRKRMATIFRKGSFSGGDGID